MDLSKLDPSVLLHMPVTAPPPGVTSNFIDPVSQAGQTQTTIYVALPVMLILLSLRIYTRARIFRAVQFDDC